MKGRQLRKSQPLKLYMNQQFELMLLLSQPYIIYNILLFKCLGFDYVLLVKYSHFDISCRYMVFGNFPHIAVRKTFERRKLFSSKYFDMKEIIGNLQFLVISQFLIIFSSPILT